MRVQWDLTNQCNLACRHCNTVRRRRGGAQELDTDEVKRIIDHLKASGVVDTILFGGGEVTTRADFLEIVRYASERGLTVWLTTNGQLLDDDLLDALMQSKLGAISVSIDGGTSETHEWLRGSGTFDRALDCLHRIGEAKRRSASSACVQLSFTLMQKNMYEAEPVGRLCSALGVDSLNFLHLVDPGLPSFDWRRHSLPPEDRLAVCTDLASMAAELQQPTLLPLPARVIHSLRELVAYQFLYTSMEERCSAGLHLSFLGVDGKLVPCNVIHGSPERVALYPEDDAQLDLRHNEFASVYFSETFTNFIRAANDPARTAQLPEICQDCAYRLRRQCQPFCLVSDLADDTAPRTCEAAKARLLI